MITPPLLLKNHILIYLVLWISENHHSLPKRPSSLTLACFFPHLSLYPSVSQHLTFLFLQCARPNPAQNLCTSLMFLPNLFPLKTFSLVNLLPFNYQLMYHYIKKISLTLTLHILPRTPYFFWGNISDQISHSVVSDSLRPHESQHTRPSCPSPTPGVHSDSRPSSQ